VYLFFCSFLASDVMIVLLLFLNSGLETFLFILNLGLAPKFNFVLNHSLSLSADLNSVDLILDTGVKFFRSRIENAIEDPISSNISLLYNP